MSQIGALFGGLFGDAGQNFVNEQGGAGKVFGKKPKVAEFRPTDLTEEQRRALEGNLSNADQIEAFLNRMVPGWSEMLKSGTQNATDLLHGIIPQDVQDQIYRSSAQKALQGGYAGSGMAHALTARDLGRTSLDLQQLGANSAQQWAKLAETSYSPFVTTPDEQFQATAANNAGGQATEQFKYNVEAAPDPGAAGTFALDTALGMQMLSFGLGAAGGAIGGAGGAARAPTANYNGYPIPANSTWTYDASTGRYMPVQRATWGGG